MKKRHVQRVLCAMMSGVILAGSAASPLAGAVSLAAELPASEENEVPEDAGEVTSADEAAEETPTSASGLAAGASRVFGGVF